MDDIVLAIELSDCTVLFFINCTRRLKAAADVIVAWYCVIFLLI